MIPKIIHYCWFGGNPLPSLAQECIASWRRFLPDYEIWQWTDCMLDEASLRDYETAGRPAYEDEEDNGNSLFDKMLSFDVDIIPYTAEAYRQKKYAYVSDYARFWIMYNHGGIYFDTDVEVIKPMNDIINKGNFMGFEQDPDGENTPGKFAPRFCFDVALGLGFGMTKGHPFMKDLMGHYATLQFSGATMSPWLKTIVAHTTELLCKKGLKNVPGIQQVDDITIYPGEYFAPINPISRRLHITQNTRTIHRYMASWSQQAHRTWKDYLGHYMPEWVFFLNNRIKRMRYKI